MDVVVADSQHNPVHKLTASDFTLFENGHPQTIATIEEHNSWESAAPLPRPPKLSPGIFTNFSIAPASGAINIVLLDTLNTPEDVRSAVRDQLLAYLKGVRPGARMAIFGLNAKLVMLQGITSDPELLSNMLLGEKDLQKTSLAATDIVNAGMPDPNDSSADFTGVGLGNTPSGPEVIVGLRAFQTVTETISPEVRAQSTLDAFNLLGHYLGKFPGRKNLIWFSGSFPINILPDGGVESSALPSAADEFRETADLLARSQVAIYPIEAKVPVGEAGQSTDVSSASDTGSQDKAAAKPAENPTPIQQTADTRETMEAVAQATGGESSTGTDDISAAVEKAIDTGSHYYTLTYAPNDQKWSGDFRKIQINAAPQGLTLAYRRGYFADDPSAPPHREPQQGLEKPQGADKAQGFFSILPAAMVRGGPDATDILFTATVQPVAVDPEPVVAPGNKVNENLKGPFRRYAVQFGIDMRALNCPMSSDGAHQCKLEAVVNVCDVDGTLLNAAGGVIEASIPAYHYASVLRSGIRFRQEVSVPVIGYPFFRIGVHEQATNKIGTLELPVAAVKDLPPIAPSSPPAQAAPPAPPAPIDATTPH